MSANLFRLFDYSPTVELLRSFLPDKAVLSEEQAFKKTWRIYIYLRTIYGDGISLGKGQYINSPLADKDTNYKFCFVDWLSQLDISISGNNANRYTIYQIKNQRVKNRKLAEENLCLLQNITIEDIWYHVFVNQEQQDKWFDSFKEYYKVQQQKILDLLKLCPFDSQSCNYKNCIRLYRLDFQHNLANSKKLYWFESEYKDNKLTGRYFKAESSFNSIAGSLKQGKSQEYKSEANAEYIPNEELADFITRFAKADNKRILFAAEFIMKANIKRSTYNKIINALEDNWNQSDCVKPLRLTYKKFHNEQPVTIIVYPVIFYYIKRGPYLYAIQTTELKGQKYQWEGYRLDRILDVEILDWNDEQVPVSLRQLKDQEELPTPEDVEDSLDTDTLGYAFWKPQKMMLVRFEREHHSKYIHDTSRQEIFQAINLENFSEISLELKNFFDKKEIALVLETLQSDTSNQYVFCIAKFYSDDIDVFLRLLSWGKNVQVILPDSLRAKIFQEVQSTLQLYQ